MSSKRVFEPIQIKSVEIPNRVVRTAHGTGFGHEIGDALIDYHVARAKGGCGLTILEAAGVHPSSSILLHAFDDRIIAGQRALMDRVRPHGMRVFQQLWHAGNLYPTITGATPWGVSTLPGPATGIVPIPMSESDILEVIDAFASAAVRCREGGMHGVEIHAAHGYIFHQFLSPLSNTRTDRWGGNLANRMEVLLQTLRAVRKAVGADFIVGVRVSASQAAGGITEEDMIAVIERIHAEGLIDYLNASWGDYYRMATMNATMETPVGYEISSSARLAAAVTVPRIVAGRFGTLDDAEQILRSGIADMVGLVRAQIADPDLVNKTREGRALEVRPCIACNQGCIGGFHRVGRMGCLVNPAVGFEAALSEEKIRRVTRRVKLLVVGGGPAGLEAARIAAKGGCEVVLAEASAQLGGLVNVAKRAPRMQGTGDIALWLEREVFRENVNVRTGTYFEAADVIDIGPDAVIVATGSLPRMDGVQIANPGQPARGVDLPHVLSSIDLLTGVGKLSGRTALVLDDTGHFEAAVAAEFLVSKGFAVNYVTRHASFAPEVHFSQRTTPILDEYLYDREFALHTLHHLVEIRVGECDIRSLHGKRIKTIPADVVVLVTANQPLRTLYDELRDSFRHIQLIGDALSPRDMQSAIADGRRETFALLESMTAERAEGG